MANKKSFWKKCLYFILFLLLLPIIIIEFIIKSIVSIKRRKRFNNTIYDKKMFLEQAEIEKIDIMEGYEFERFIKTLYFYLGYEVQITPKGKDFGADLVLNKDNTITAVQLKRYSGKVGIKAVQEIISAQKHYKANETMVLTNSYFTPEAETIAKEYSVQLVDRTELVELIAKVRLNLGNMVDCDSVNSADMYKFRI